MPKQEQKSPNSLCSSNRGLALTQTETSQGPRCDVPDIPNGGTAIPALSWLLKSSHCLRLFLFPIGSSPGHEQTLWVGTGTSKLRLFGFLPKDGSALRGAALGHSRQMSQRCQILLEQLWETWQPSSPVLKWQHL